MSPGAGCNTQGKVNSFLVEEWEFTGTDPSKVK